MHIGTLEFEPLAEAVSLVAEPIKRLAETDLSDFIYVAPISADFADTVSFCKHYGVDLGISTNCLIIEAKRADKIWYAACLVLADDTADVNGIIRRTLHARKTSFAPKDTALELTHMEYGGITPVGLPVDWQIYVDEAIMQNEVVVIGGGLRRSKIALKTEVFYRMPNVTVMKLTKVTK